MDSSPNDQIDILAMEVARGEQYDHTVSFGTKNTIIRALKATKIKGGGYNLLTQERALVLGKRRTNTTN